MTSINIPTSAMNAFEGNMRTGSAVELPFSAPPFFIVNGDGKLATLKNFQYYGGFACGASKVKDAAENWKDVPYPIPGLNEYNLHLEDGTQIDVLGGRALMVAPIGIRQFSTKKEANGRKTRVAPFTPGARPGLQALCLLGYRDESKNFHAWAPILITASGYQVNHVQKAFDTYRKAIKPFVKKLVPDATESVLNLFWMYIGTFGERHQESVGNGRGTKQITPIVSYIPEDLDSAKVENMYVGAELAEFMAEKSEEASEWLKVFANMQPPAKPATQPETGFMDEPPLPEDDIPF